MPWWLAGPAAFLFCTVMALFPMAAGWLFKRWQPASFWQQAALFAGLLAAGDWMRSWLFTGFPWLALGYSQTPPSPLAGFAPLFGVFGLSALVALSGALLLRLRVGATVLVVLSLTGFGLRQIEWTSPQGEPVSVALIQGNIPQEMKFRPEAFIRTLNLYRDPDRRQPGPTDAAAGNRLPGLPRPAARSLYRCPESAGWPPERRHHPRHTDRRQQRLLQQRHQPRHLAATGLQQEPSGALRRIHPARLRMVHGLRQHSRIVVLARPGKAGTAGRSRPAGGRQHLLRGRFRQRNHPRPARGRHPGQPVEIPPGSATR